MIVIAGEFQGVKGPAKTFSPVNLFDVRLNPGGRVDLSFPESENAALMVMQGDVKVNGETDAKGLDFVLFAHAGEGIAVESKSEARFVVLNGESIDEPQVVYGPFVMNTEAEIYQAIADFQQGKFGTLED